MQFEMIFRTIEKCSYLIKKDEWWQDDVKVIGFLIYIQEQLDWLCVVLQNDRDKIANLIEEALRSCFNKQMMTPGMVSLTNLPTQTTLLLPGPEFPCLQHLTDGSIAHAVVPSNDNVISNPPKISGFSESIISKASQNHEDAEPPTMIAESNS